MSDASTEALKSISTLLQNDSTFFIPSYQRGYRWKNEQVTQLLDDIKEFADNKKLEEKPDENYYCLQPLVVKKRENTDDGKGNWEVIDGQQRLTTIYLILHYLNHNEKIPTEFQHLFNKFKIRYETRENQKHNSHKFLENISNPENRRANENTNVDFLFMSKAYEAIEKWFANNSVNCDILLKKVKFIWHEIEKEDSRKVFTRINTGKIPLSNAELIKALFFQRKNFGDYEQTIQRKQLEIAMEWDEIEYTLQNNEFWYFLNTEKCQSPTRIEFIFDLIAEKKDSKDKDHSFKHFYKKLKNEKGEDLHKAITEQWKKVRNYYLTFLDWYNDVKLYHHIGFLITTNKIKIYDTIEEYQQVEKSDFNKLLLKKIRETVKSDDIKNLTYGVNNDLIKNILLIFNIQHIYLNNKDKVRFPFQSYNLDSHTWSLEHIHAQNSESLTTAKQWIQWLEDHNQALDECDTMKLQGEINENNVDIEQLKKDIKEKINSLNKKLQEYKKEDKKTKLEENEKNEFINDFYNKIINLFKNTDDGINYDGIGNLTLLEKSHNSKLNNSIFPIKRNKIKNEIDNNNSVFLPPCSRYVFMKYFTNEPEQFHYWSKQDADDYVLAIEKTLKDYLPGITTTEGQ